MKKYPTILPVSILIFPELYRSGLLIIQIELLIVVLVLGVCSALITLWLGKSDELWRVPLIGLILWEMVRILMDYSERRFLGFSYYILGVLFLVAIFLLFTKRVKIPRRAWEVSLLFIIVLFLITFDSSQPISENLNSLSISLEKWAGIAIPIIVIVSFMNKKYGWNRYLIYSSWGPISITLFSVSRMYYAAILLHPVIYAAFWILPTIIFYIMIPALFISKNGNSVKIAFYLSIAAVAFVFIAYLKWVYLIDPEIIYAYPTKVLIMKSSIQLWFPFFLIHLIDKYDE